MIRVARVLVLACLAGPACNKSEAKGRAEKSAGSWTPLPLYKLQVLVAKPAKVIDTSTGDIKQLTIEGAGATFTLGPADEDEAKASLEDMIEAITPDATDTVTISRKDALADGFDLEVTTDSGQVAVEVRRTIGGVAYSCGVETATASVAKIVREACLSLKAL